MNMPPEYIPIAISLAAFFSILLLFIGLFINARQKAKKRSIIDKIQRQSYGDGFQSPPPLPETGKVSGGLARFFGSIGQSTADKKEARHSDERIKFLRAGIRSLNAPAIFWGVKLFFLLALPIIFLLLRTTLFQTLSKTYTIYLLVGFALVGFYVADVWLKLKTSIRKDEIVRGFPDALDLMVVCIEAGMGLDAAISRVAKEMEFTNKPLSSEFQFYNNELMAGQSRNEALKNLSSRVNAEEINNLITLLIQADKFGTSVAETLRVYSDTFRTRRYMRAEEVAAKLGVKLLIPLIIFIFPALFVVILGPALIKIFEVFNNLQ